MDTGEMSAEYARPNQLVKLNYPTSIRWSRRPSRKRRPCELRAGAVNARRPRRRRGRSAAKSIDGAEHSSRIERVMAGASFPPTFGHVCATKSGTFRGAISGRCGDAIARPIHVERDAGSRDVSDPVEWRWGQVRGPGRGSLTSRLRYYPRLFGRQQTPPVPFQWLWRWSRKFRRRRGLPRGWSVIATGFLKPQNTPRPGLRW
jgi:hypothetical protein